MPKKKRGRKQESEEEEEEEEESEEDYDDEEEGERGKRGKKDKRKEVKAVKQMKSKHRHPCMFGKKCYRSGVKLILVFFLVILFFHKKSPFLNSKVYLWTKNTILKKYCVGHTVINQVFNENQLLSI